MVHNLQNLDHWEAKEASYERGIIINLDIMCF